MCGRGREAQPSEKKRRSGLPWSLEGGCVITHQKDNSSLTMLQSLSFLQYPFESIVIASWEFLVSFCGSI